MLFMLTPEIKTNLILKEIGIKRYSLRSKMPHSIEKGLHYYQKGLILALLDKPFEDFIKEHQDFIKAIIEATKSGDGPEELIMLPTSQFLLVCVQPCSLTATMIYQSNRPYRNNVRKYQQNQVQTLF